MAQKLSSEGLKSAADMAKQIITLSTGVIALTVTFLEKIAQPVPGAGSRTLPWALVAAWLLFGLAILGGVATLGAISGSLDAIDRKLNGLTTTAPQEEAISMLASSSNVRIPARIMSVAFLAAMGLTIIAGFIVH